MWGASLFEDLASAEDAAIQPAWRPITSRIKTFVEVSDIDSTSSDASSVEVAIYFAAEPNPGQQSVTARSLSTVFGIAMQLMV